MAAMLATTDVDFICLQDIGMKLSPNVFPPLGYYLVTQSSGYNRSNEHFQFRGSVAIIAKRGWIVDGPI